MLRIELCKLRELGEFAIYFSDNTDNINEANILSTYTYMQNSIYL